MNESKPLDSDEIKRLMEFTQHDLATCLSDRQISRVIKELETDLLVRPPTGRRFNEAADKILKQWARVYKSTDSRFIQKETGALITNSPCGAAVSLDDPQFDYVHSVLVSMTKFNRAFIYFHYTGRTKKVIDYFRDSEGNETNELGITYDQYKHDLSDAKYEFIVMGGIN